MLTKSRANFIQAIKFGMPANELEDELDQIIAKQDELEKHPEPMLHPAMRDYHRKQV